MHRADRDRRALTIVCVVALDRGHAPRNRRAPARRAVRLGRGARARRPRTAHRVRRARLYAGRASLSPLPRSPAPGRSPRPRSSSARRRAPTGCPRSPRRSTRSDGESPRAPSPRRPPPATSRARRTRHRASGGRRPARRRGPRRRRSRCRMSRSVMIPGPWPSGSITTAAPTWRSDISRAAARSVCPGPTVRTVGLIPSRTCILMRSFPARTLTHPRSPARLATIASM